MAFRCKYMEGCPMYDLLTTSVRIIQLQPFLRNYCEHETNHVSCVRYGNIEKGVEPPSTLLPNGENLKV